MTFSRLLGYSAASSAVEGHSTGVGSREHTMPGIFTRTSDRRVYLLTGAKTSAN